LFGQCNADTCTDGNRHSHGHGSADRDCHRNGHGNRNGRAKRDRNSDGNSDSDADCHRYRDRNPDGDSHGNRNSNGDRHRDSNSDGCSGLRTRDRSVVRDRGPQRRQRDLYRDDHPLRRLHLAANDVGQRSACRSNGDFLTQPCQRFFDHPDADRGPVIGQGHVSFHGYWNWRQSGCHPHRERDVDFQIAVRNDFSAGAMISRRRFTDPNR
jgi:hypothetical protein